LSRALCISVTMTNPWTWYCNGTECSFCIAILICRLLGH